MIVPSSRVGQKRKIRLTRMIAAVQLNVKAILSARAYEQKFLFLGAVSCVISKIRLSFHSMANLFFNFFNT